MGGTILSDKGMDSPDKMLGLEQLFNLYEPVKMECGVSIREEAPNNKYVSSIKLFGQQVPTRTYLSIQCNALQAKDSSRKVPKLLVIVVKINGKLAHALVDSGSLGDFISSTLVQQLKIKKKKLTSPVPIQLAVQGSRS